MALRSIALSMDLYDSGGDLTGPKVQVATDL